MQDDNGKFDSYNARETNPEAFFGLPKEVQFCSRCVISNQRPNSTVEFHHRPDSRKQTISFNENRVCNACLVAEKKRKEIDWEDRENQLINLCAKYRKNDNGYDCLVPGSGGKDSFVAAHLLKYKYGMNPVTVTWAPHLYTDWGWKNFQSWINAGFDNYLVTPNPKIHRLITRLAVENLFHPFQPFILGQKSLAPKMADKLGIPLIFYGENEAEYGNPMEDMELSTRDQSFFSNDPNADIVLGGVSKNELLTSYNLKLVDLDPYMPLSSDIAHEKKIQVHYLGYYIPWHPQGAYYYAVENGGFQASPERTPGTYSKYNSIDDKIDDFHYYATYIKFGIGRATYDAAQEIRNREIDRSEGIALVKKYDGEFPERFSKEIFEYLSIQRHEYPVASSQFEQHIMDREYFFHVADSFRSPHLWFRDAAGWKLRHTVWRQ